MESSIALATFPQNLVQEFSTYQLKDSLSYIDPDVIVAEDSSDIMDIQRVCDSDVDVLSIEKINKRPNRFYCSSESGLQLVCVGDYYDLQEISQMESDGKLDTGSETYILSSLLDIEVDLIELSVDLKGERKYLSALYDDGLDGNYTHLTVEASPKYSNVWNNSFKVNGAFSQPESDEFETSHGIGICKLFDHGIVDADVFEPSLFGLEAIDEVGEKRAQILSSNGYRTIQSVADASIPALQQLKGFGPKNSPSILYSARSQANGELYVKSKEYLPDESYDPVFIDIETDGISSTIIWLIGVYDSWTGSYMNFMTTDLSSPGEAVTSFLSWVESNCPNRPIVAYNGMEFDFPIIHHHATQYCDELLDMWEDAWHFDPLWWGPRKDNAIFPSKTNKQSDVTTALGWDSETNLTGAVVGKRFSQWKRHSGDIPEPDWSEYKTYTEDDVRSLQHLYNQILDSDVIVGKPDSNTTDTNKLEQTQDIDNNEEQNESTDFENTEQGSLEGF